MERMVKRKELIGDYLGSAKPLCVGSIPTRASNESVAYSALEPPKSQCSVYCGEWLCLVIATIEANRDWSSALFADSLGRSSRRKTCPSSITDGFDLARPDSLHSYQISKRGNSLRVMAEAVRWGKRHRSGQHDQPRHHHHPLANDELKGPRGLATAECKNRARGKQRDLL
jgi:hypothetical protein